jgi:hypothetical protein
MWLYIIFDTLATLTPNKVWDRKISLTPKSFHSQVRK